MKSNFITLILIVFFDIFTAIALSAQSSTGAPPPIPVATAAVESEEPVAEAEEDKSPFEISGFVDAYYAYSPNDMPLPTSFTNSVNSFELGMANLKFSKEGKVGFVADLAVGPRAEGANGFSGTTLSAIKQLYVTYSPADWVNFTFGNFSTFVGYELIDSPDNINYSVSYMFSNGPFFHTGIKADFSLSEKIGAMVGVFNDTDSKIDFTPGKHLGAQLSYSGDALTVYLNYLTGKTVEGDSLFSSVITNQIDLTATLQATEKLGLGLNTTMKSNDIDDAEPTSWFGAAIYANYAFGDAFTLGLRGEYIGDSDGLILGYTDGSVLSMTLSGNFHSGPLTIIPEFRMDMANEEAFSDADGKPTQSLPVFLLAAVYAF
ncbi:MAG TPA: porin [Saprospiraceae bacterium]|nr:porin [Saprospiraceae bacterium]HMQ85688.1 porin [Saprospiraceae bacterium]